MRRMVRMKILCKNKNIGLSSIQNSIAKYLYKNLGGGYSKKISSTDAEVRTAILYQIPYDIRSLYGINDEEYSEVSEMDVMINITTYSNKIRLDIVEITPEEKTIGFKTFDESTFDNIQTGIKKVYEYVCNQISSEFKDYDVLF